MTPLPGRPPSVHRLASSLQHTGLPHPLLVRIAQETVGSGVDPASEALRLASLRQGELLQSVVNATGVLLHTNLGRAPVGLQRDERPVNVELSLATGKRSRRGGIVSELLEVLTGAPACLVVNNGAAAALLAMSVVAGGRPVIVSRGELVEIGGGFRVPEVIECSGARLVEVGTTNRARLADYASAIEAARAEQPIVLKVHQSNYHISGFVSSVAVKELAPLGVPIVADIGSGLLDSNTPWLEGAPPTWLADEPAARQTLSDGASLVTFSGDKLLGGPQCGVIAGDAALVAGCARHALYRALRPGSMVLAALQDVLCAYARRDAMAIPFWRMATAPVAELRERAAVIASAVGAPSVVVDCMAVAGGGSLPGNRIPSAGVALPGDLVVALRRHRPSVIATCREGRTICDLRSVFPDDDEVIIRALKAACSAI